MKYLLPLIALVILSGCASQYTQPHVGVKNAKLRLVSVPSNNNFISLAPNKQCISKRSTVHIATLGSKANLVRSLSRINMPMYNSDIPDSHQNEVYIPATGDTFAFQFEGVGITGFTPGQVDTKAGIDTDFTIKTSMR